MYFTEVLYNNPDRKKQCEDLPYSSEHPYFGHQKWVSSLVNTDVQAGDDLLFW